MKNFIYLTLFFLPMTSMNCQKQEKLQAKKTNKWVYGDTITGTIDTTSVASLALDRSGLVTQIIRNSGARVKKDQIIAAIDTKDLEMERRLALLEREQISLKLEYLKTKSQRLEALSSRKLIELQSYEDTAFDYKLNLSLLETAALKIADLNKKIKASQLVASQDGIILKSYKNVGEYYQPNEPLVQFMSDKERYLKLNVPDYLWGRIKIGSSITYNTLNFKIKGAAKVAHISPLLQGEVSQFFTVIAELGDTESEMPIGAQVYIDYRK